jgi:hypothetical protein
MLRVAVVLVCLGSIANADPLLRPETYGTTIGPPGYLATLTPSSTKADVAALTPPSGGDPAYIEFEKDGRLRYILIGPLPDDAGAILDKAWGKGAVDRWKQTYWLNARTGWRVKYTPWIHQLEISGYIPVAAQLGSGLDLAVLRPPVFGLTEDEISKAYPSWKHDPLGGGYFVVPGQEWGSDDNTVGVSFDPKTKKANQVEIAMNYVTDEQRAALLALLEAKWGPSKAVKIKDEDGVAFPKAKGVRVTAIERSTREIGAFVLELERP